MNDKWIKWEESIKSGRMVVNEYLYKKLRVLNMKKRRGKFIWIKKKPNQDWSRLIKIKIRLEKKYFYQLNAGPMVEWGENETDCQRKRKERD